MTMTPEQEQEMQMLAVHLINARILRDLATKSALIVSEHVLRELDDASRQHNIARATVCLKRIIALTILALTFVACGDDVSPTDLCLDACQRQSECGAQVECSSHCEALVDLVSTTPAACQEDFRAEWRCIASVDTCGQIERDCRWALPEVCR
jgi:hypothetical protein